jgi:hypothetical protein
LKLGSLILKMDRAEAAATAATAATAEAERLVETQQAKFRADKKAWRAREQAEVGDPAMAGIQQQAPAKVGVQEAMDRAKAEAAAPTAEKKVQLAKVQPKETARRTSASIMHSHSYRPGLRQLYKNHCFVLMRNTAARFISQLDSEPPWDGQTTKQMRSAIPVPVVAPNSRHPGAAALNSKARFSGQLMDQLNSEFGGCLRSASQETSALHWAAATQTEVLGTTLPSASKLLQEIWFSPQPIFSCMLGEK